MHEADDLTEETEEIILKRARDEVEKFTWRLEEGKEQTRRELAAITVTAPHDGTGYYGINNRGKWITAATIEKGLQEPAQRLIVFSGALCHTRQSLSGPGGFIGRQNDMKSDSSLLSAYLGIARRTPEESVLRLLAEFGVEAVGADEGSLLALDRERGDLVFVMTVGDMEAEQSLGGQRVPLGQGLSGLAAVTREVQIGAPVYKDILQQHRTPDSGGQPAWVLAAPMLVRDEVVGVFTAATFDSEKPFTAAHAALFAKLAAVAGVCVEQHRRLRELEAMADPEVGPVNPKSEAERMRGELLDEMTAFGRAFEGREATLLALLRALRAACPAA